MKIYPSDFSCSGSRLSDYTLRYDCEDCSRRLMVPKIDGHILAIQFSRKCPNKISINEVDHDKDMAVAA